jgi:hypothetical protein
VVGASSWDLSVSAATGLKRKDSGLQFFEWRDGFRRLANTMALRWPHLRQPLERYADHIRHLSERYRKSRPQGFALYDLAYRAKASAIFARFQRHTDFKPDTATHEEVFSGALPSLCAKCGGVDHYAVECGGGSGGSSGGGSDNRSNRGGRTGNAANKPSDTRSNNDFNGDTCRRFNSGKGCPDGKGCKYTHDCVRCGAKGHGQTSCPDPPL